MSVDLPSEIVEKYQLLKNIIHEMDEVVVAFSAGVDSTLLAKVCFDVLGDRATAVTADSPTLPRRDLQETVELANAIGIKHQIIKTDELQNPDYARNDQYRCYYCKNELCDQLDLIKAKTNSKWVLFGENLDDSSDYRPGSLAASEHGVRAPLRDAGFTKVDIRALARYFGLPTWNKPASACLASRIPYGEAVSIEKLTQIEKAESVLWELGYRGMRVRYHGDIARIEVPPEQMPGIIGDAPRVTKSLQKIGFRYITLDLSGYRRGSLNEGLIQL
jgi:pyridinium-3,5-biscarboxylic acid mononucleotide sulfurtransferase